MWTETDGGDIAEPFNSTRHSLDADSFSELQVTINYNHYYAYEAFKSQDLVTNVLNVF